MYEIKVFEENDTLIWDDFIFNDSINGTFLQSRNFLQYHPKDRFNDFSLVVMNKEKVCALVPGCVIYKDNEKIFFH
jgi:hypothetical protein